MLQKLILLIKKIELNLQEEEQLKSKAIKRQSLLLKKDRVLI